MDIKSSISLLLLLVSLTSLLWNLYSSSEDDLKGYIVYTGNSRNNETSSLIHYKNLLQQVADRNQPRFVLQHYKRSFSGFVAKLSTEEAKRMAGLDGVVSVFLNKKRHLLTTKSWDFIGFPQQVETESSGSDVIIGVIDSVIWPESKSFNDKGFSPPPAKWKGICQTSDFPCNNKIIGARHYISIFDEPLNEKDLNSPRDSSGHGTHTASTAAGNPVSMANMLGFAQGTTRGGTPSARIAVYKACWSRGCSDSNILQAFDDAISDGVDIVSVSLAAISKADALHFSDAISVGAFHAMRHGVLPVLAAGNSGPTPASLENFSPWGIVVAANTIDRKFVTMVKLGDNRIYEGVSLNTIDHEGKLYPIIYGGDAANTTAGVNSYKSKFFLFNTLNDTLVKGKIVLCEGSVGAHDAFRAGAIGILTQSHANIDTAYSYPLQSCLLNSKDAANILKYIYSTSNPTATIFRTNELDDTLAPVVASFSSRGPNTATAEILKPDLTAHGVDIIASWPSITPISDIQGDNRTSEFNIMSGTSMATPHVSGAAAYVKSFHHTWSPAAIRSALMTTATQINPENNRDAEFAYGAGQINPVKVVNPGLIYDAEESDYVRFLCGQGFNTSALQFITGDDSNCSDTKNTSAKDLNYPSFALKAPQPKNHLSGSFRRTVTNVGLSVSTYYAIVTGPKGLKISVNPNILSFTSYGEKKMYVLTIEGKIKKSIESASLVWDDGNIKVRSPIVIFDDRAMKVEASPNFHVQNIVVIISIIVVVIILICICIIIIRKYR